MDFLRSIIVELLLGLVGAGGGVPLGILILKRVARWWNRRKWAIGMREIGEMDTALEATRKVLKAKVGRIIKSTNTKGIPTPASAKIYSTVEWETPRVGHRGSRWQHQTSDDHMRRLIQRVLNDPVIEVDLDEAPEGTLLGDLYRAEGTATALIARVGCGNGALWYITFHFAEPYNLTARDREAMRSLRNHLRDLLRL